MKTTYSYARDSGRIKDKIISYLPGGSLRREGQPPRSSIPLTPVQKWAWASFYHFLSPLTKKDDVQWTKILYVSLCDLKGSKTHNLWIRDFDA